MNEAEQIGYRDGRDAYLLDKPKNNPYKKSEIEFLDYENGWKDGYNEEADVCIK